MQFLMQKYCQSLKYINFFLAGFFSCCSHAIGQPQIKVTQQAWNGLSGIERENIQHRYIVELVEMGTYGVIVDNQGIDESTPGTSGGAILGSSIANAAYIDNAIKNGNYSAKNQLAIGVIGAVLGASLDSKRNSQFHFRYAIKFPDGNVKYFDVVRNDAFRHPVGLCVSVPNIELIEQNLCNQTGDILRSEYFFPGKIIPSYSIETAPNVLKSSESDVDSKHGSAGKTLLIMCKLGSLAPVLTSEEKCSLIRGSKVK